MKLIKITNSETKMNHKLTPAEIQILSEAQSFKKRKHVAHHIGRDISDDDWEAVKVARNEAYDEDARREKIRKERAAARFVKPMISAGQRLKWSREAAAREARYAASKELDAERTKRHAAVRETLKRAARIARAMGFEVRKSTDRARRVSSYYARRENHRPIRISDHELPYNKERECISRMHGGGSPFEGQIIIDASITDTRIKRMLILAEAGRI